MAGEHHPRFALGVQDGHGVAVHVGADVVGEAFDLLAPDAARRLLKTRRPRRVEQLLQECDGLNGPSLSEMA